MEGLQAFLMGLPVYFGMACQLIGAVAVFATVVVKFTPSKSDDVKVHKVLSKVMAFMDFLPTIGVNPRTKEIKEAMKSLKQ